MASTSSTASSARSASLATVAILCALGAVAVRDQRADACGWSGDAMEAQAFAYLAVRAKRGLPYTYPTTTGAPRPMTGGVLVEP